MGKSRYTVKYSTQASRDLEEIFSFIAADNPLAAERFTQRLVDEAEAIAAHPLAGRLVPEFHDPLVRERIFRAYRIIHRVDQAKRLITVSRFWHAARGTPVIHEADDLPSEST